MKKCARQAWLSHPPPGGLGAFAVDPRTPAPRGSMDSPCSDRRLPRRADRRLRGRVPSLIGPKDRRQKVRHSDQQA
eukprot:1583586-Alexandrium_andersonii.AAC.1